MLGLVPRVVSRWCHMPRPLTCDSSESTLPRGEGHRMPPRPGSRAVLPWAASNRLQCAASRIAHGDGRAPMTGAESMRKPGRRGASKAAHLADYREQIEAQRDTAREKQASARQAQRIRPGDRPARRGVVHRARSLRAPPRHPVRDGEVAARSAMAWSPGSARSTAVRWPCSRRISASSAARWARPSPRRWSS